MGEPSELVVAAPDPDQPGWRREAVGPDQVRNDAAVAGALLVGALLSMVLQRTTGFYGEPAEGWVALLCLAAATLPLALRRRYPSAVAVVITVAFVVTAELLVPETLFINITLFMALYTVGAWEPDRRRATAVRLGIVVVMFAWLIISLFRSVTDPDSMPDLSRAGVFSPLVAFMLIQLLTNILYFAGAYWFGDHAWASARERARTAYRGRLLQIERQVVEQQAVTLERLRLARELHDAVAHHVSMMGVQAAAARTLLGTDLERAARALEQVEDSARQSIDELQGVLGMLRETAREPATGDDPALGEGPAGDLTARVGRHAPDGVGSLSVERLPELVERTVEAGLGATYQVVGDPVPLPPLVSLNLYRIAQEALTNTRKHGGVRARADVRLRYLPGAVELEVADDGAGGRRASTPSSGLGLVGMRERVAADGGTLEAGPRQRGGFLVRAQVPLRSDRDD
ncbi:sensor histidine kinase [Actinotalea sp. BY-33]|uniref:histidine kinase n=1 Tax=Actinotalea soli TaxID=2819234 RepID=A0A939LNP5_9CELL|nr:sensor histidine kinase [Actinotalea soli]